MGSRLVVVLHNSVGAGHGMPLDLEDSGVAGLHDGRLCADRSKDHDHLKLPKGRNALRVGRLDSPDSHNLDGLGHSGGMDPPRCRDGGALAGA